MFHFIHRLLGNNFNSPATKGKRQRGRTLRIEELESREMLDAGLVSALADMFAYYVETPNIAEYAPDTGGLTPPALAQTAPSAAPPANAHTVDLAILENAGLIEEGKEQEGVSLTWNAATGRLTNIVILPSAEVEGALDLSGLTALQTLHVNGTGGMSPNPGKLESVATRLYFYPALA